MRFYDPYYLIDPTRKAQPIQHRDLSGLPRHLRLGGNAIQNVNAPDFEETIPIEARFWMNSATAARKRLDAISEDFRYQVIPDETRFSWRMIYELYAEAEYALTKGASQADAIAAAHKYLADKQYETARTQLDRLIGDCKETNAIDMSEVLSNWMSENWDTIPEVGL